MFTRKPDKSDRVARVVEEPRSAVPQAPAQPAYSGNWSNGSVGGAERMGSSVIGSDLTVIGNLQSKGEVTVEGQIQGDIHCAMLTVGPNAQVTGGIVAEEVVVQGRVLGSIRGNKVTLQSSSHVEGDVFHKSLAIEQGAFFEGKSRRAEDPMAGAQQLASGNGLGEAPTFAGSSMTN